MSKKTKELRLTTVEHIKNIHNGLKKIVIDSGIQEPQYNFAIKNLEKQPEEYRIKLLAWFLDFKEGPYAGVENLLKQFSAWENYKILGINSFPEQVLLRRKQKILREAWHKRIRN